MYVYACMNVYGMYVHWSDYAALFAYMDSRLIAGSQTQNL